MIQQNSENGNTQIELNSSFIRTIKEMKISKLLHEANIRKDARTLTGENSGEKRTAFEIFQFLLLMVFQGCNLYRYLGSKRQDIACSKSTYHRFLSDRHYNWKMFITRLAARVRVCVSPCPTEAIAGITHRRKASSAIRKAAQGLARLVFTVRKQATKVL